MKFAANILGAMASLSSAIELEYLPQYSPYFTVSICDWFYEECSGAWWRSPCYEDFDASGKYSIRYDWDGWSCGRIYMYND